MDTICFWLLVILGPSAVAVAWFDWRSTVTGGFDRGVLDPSHQP